MHDLVIRGGRIVDGTGDDAFDGDIAVSDGVITDVGEVSGEAKRTIAADGRVVTPGFVDIHTHYDAQATWDPHLLPSGWHGVTDRGLRATAAWASHRRRPDRREWLIGLMEGVEDIPGAALSEGIQLGLGDASRSISTPWSARRPRHRSWAPTCPTARCAPT